MNNWLNIYSLCTVWCIKIHLTSSLTAVHWISCQFIVCSYSSNQIRGHFSPVSVYTQKLNLNWVIENSWCKGDEWTHLRKAFKYIAFPDMYCLSFKGAVYTLYWLRYSPSDEQPSFDHEKSTRDFSRQNKAQTMRMWEKYKGKRRYHFLRSLRPPALLICCRAFGSNIYWSNLCCWLINTQSIHSLHVKWIPLRLSAHGCAICMMAEGESNHCVSLALSGFHEPP